MGVCNQITFVILHCISSRLVTFLKVIDAPIQVPNALDLTVSFKFLNFSSQLCLLFFLFLTSLFQSPFCFNFTETYSNSETRNILIVCIWYILSDNKLYVQIFFYFVLSIKLFCKRV